jgi:hypothetical protein
MICSPLWYSLTKKGKTDNDLGYATYLPIHQSMVRFCEAQNWEGKKFAADFNMAIALRDPFTGYHTSKTGFKTQHLPDIQNAEIIILDSTGDIKQIPENQKEEFVLKKRFENKNHWGEIYLRRNPDNK